MIKCNCGNKTCTTKVYLETNSVDVNIVMEWHDEKDRLIYHSCGMNSNEMVQLIKELKRKLLELTNEND